MLIQPRIVYLLALSILFTVCVLSEDIKSEQPVKGTTPARSPTPAKSKITPEPGAEQGDQCSGADLVVRFMILMMAGQQGNCVNKYTPYGIRVVIENQGHGDANTFWVGVNKDLIQVEEGLVAGQSLGLHFSGTVPSGTYTATVDVFDQVKELNEDNNLETFLAPTPTPPPICTPTPTP